MGGEQTVLYGCGFFGLQFANKEIGADIELIDGGDGQGATHAEVELFASDTNVLFADGAAEQLD